MSFWDADTKAAAEGEFSEPVTVENDSLSVETRGIFEEVFDKVDPETGLTVLSKNPRAILYSREIEAEMGEIEEGWFLTARSVKYRIKEPQHFEGMIVMELKRA